MRDRKLWTTKSSSHFSNFFITLTLFCLSTMSYSQTKCKYFIEYAMKTEYFKKSISCSFDDTITIVLCDKSHRLHEDNVLNVDSYSYRISHQPECDSFSPQKHSTQTKLISQNVIVIYKLERKRNGYLIGFWRPINGGHFIIDIRKKNRKYHTVSYRYGSI